MNSITVFRRNANPATKITRIYVNRIHSRNFRPDSITKAAIAQMNKHANAFILSFGMQKGIFHCDRIFLIKFFNRVIFDDISTKKANEHCLPLNILLMIILCVNSIE